MENKKMNYTLRELKADDMFPMFRILSKIGVKDIRKCFESVDLVGAVRGNEESVNAVGVTVFFEIVGMIIDHLPDCKNEIYKFLESVSSLSASEIAEMTMVDFTEMIIAVIKKEEFKDFFQVVFKLFNQGN